LNVFKGKKILLKDSKTTVLIFRKIRLVIFIFFDVGENSYLKTFLAASIETLVLAFFPANMNLPVFAVLLRYCCPCLKNAD